MKKIKNLFVLLMVLMSVGMVPVIGASAVERNIVEKTLLKGQYGMFPIGDRLYALKYSDGSVEMVMERTDLMRGSIVSIPVISYVSGSAPVVPVTLKGIDASIDGSSSHKHRLEVYDSATGGLVKAFEYNVPSGQTVNVQMNFDSMAPGAYMYSVKEIVYINTMFEVHDGSTVACGGSMSKFWTVPLYTGQPSPFTGGVYCNPPGLPDPYTLSVLTKMSADIGVSVAGDVKTFSVTTSQGPDQASGSPAQTPGAIDNAKSKPKIIPPAISRLSKLIVSWFRGLTGLSIMGGESVEIILNQPYNSSVSLEFAAYDSCNVDNPPDRCSMKYAEWFVVDPGRKLVKESGWSSELKDSPFTANIYFVPRGPGTYYVVALLVRQDYTYTASGWSMKEVVEKKELQKVRVVRQAPPPSDGSRPSRPPGNFFGGWLSGIKTLIPGF